MTRTNTDMLTMLVLCMLSTTSMSTTQKTAGPMAFTATDAFGFVLAGGE